MPALTRRILSGWGGAKCKRSPAGEACRIEDFTGLIDKLRIRIRSFELEPMREALVDPELEGVVRRIGRAIADRPLAQRWEQPCPAIHSGIDILGNEQLVSNRSDV